MRMDSNSNTLRSHFQLANCLKSGQMAESLRKRMVKKQTRSVFFCMKKKAAKQGNWRNPTAEEKAEVANDLNDIIIIDSSLNYGALCDIVMFY